MAAHWILKISYLKRYFIFSSSVLLVCLCYIGINSPPSFRNLLMSFVASSHNYQFENHRLSFLTRNNTFTIDKQKWHKTSIYEIFDRHKPRTSESCLNVCDTKKDVGCAATNVTEWAYLMLSPNFTFMPLMSESEYIYPFEVDYLSQPPLTDLKQLPSLTLSKVTIDGAEDDDVFCDVGDVIKGRVDLVDGYGKRRILGGDDVRVWIKGGQSKQNRAVGHVTDLRNGSYKISFRCLWSGQVQLNVAVAYPREYLRTVILQTHLGVTWYYVTKFKKKKVEEITLCFSTPNIPGRPCLCNLTSTNRQSLYCGRPLDSRLTCDDFVETISLQTPIVHNVTPTEDQLIKDTPKKISRNRILHNITVKVTSSGNIDPLKPCTETSPKETWEVWNGPSGYWTTGNVWKSMICLRPNMTSEWATSCLKNTAVWVFGDSNGIRLTKAVSDLTKAVDVQPGRGLTEFIKMDKQNNITFTFRHLEYPYYVGPRWRSYFYGDVSKQIDNIPSDGTHVIVIHYYLHIATSHLSVIFLRLKAVKEAVLRLINRNPDVLVGIRGPHVSSVEHRWNHAIGGDSLGKYIQEMVRFVFADLKHKVVFLDGWDMTIAIENLNYHPVPNVAFEMMRTLLAFKCS